MPSLDDVTTIEPSGDTIRELIGESSEASVRMHHHVRSRPDGNTPSTAPVGSAQLHPDVHAAKRCTTRHCLTGRVATWIVARLAARSFRAAGRPPGSLAPHGVSRRRAARGRDRHAAQPHPAPAGGARRCLPREHLAERHLLGRAVEVQRDQATVVTQE